MEENTIDVHEVKGMGICTDLHAITYIVFCKTKSANVEFYRWFFKKVFVKFVLDCRIHYSIDNSIPAYFFLDCEPDQINPMREDDTICPVCCSTRHWALITFYILFTQDS